MKEFDAFISYETSSGQSLAFKLCEHLEKNGLQCWIAPRNIQYGHSYAGVISGAVKSSVFLVCIYTDNTNESQNVKRELELANANKVSILPFVVSNVPFDGDMEYYFAANQQIRASKSQIEQGFDNVLDTIKARVKKDEPCVAQTTVTSSPSQETPKVIEQKPKGEKTKKKIILSTGIAALLTVAVITLFMLKMNEKEADNDIVEETTAEEEQVTAEPKVTFSVNGMEFVMVMVNDTMYAGETEVTQGLWKEVMGSTVEEQRDKANPAWSTRGTGHNHPMYYVNIAECKDFAKKLSMITGKRFELPTEKEWEMCISGEVQSTTDDIAWHSDNSNECVHPVAGKQANGLGIYDMAGNVCEWCNTENGTGKYVCRGGDWCMSGKECSVEMKDQCNAEIRRSSLGFRIVMKTSK